MKLIIPKSKRLLKSDRPTNKSSIVDALDYLIDGYHFNVKYNLETYLKFFPPCGFNKASLLFAIAAHDVIEEQKPVTVRQVFYRMVSLGFFPDTGKSHYTKLLGIIKILRRRGAVPFDAIIDNLRSTQKPSSWSGLQDYAETVARVYRKDFWAEMPDYVEIICEKDALSGVIYPITAKYDVSLQVIRGAASDSFAFHIANQWNRIQKPIYVYYIGDHDPSGMDIERDISEKLSEFSGRSMIWERLAINESDLKSVIPLKVKQSDTRAKAYLQKYGNIAAEADAIEPKELKRRVETAINRHIDQDRWEKLQGIEQAEKESLKVKLIDNLK